MKNKLDYYYNLSIDNIYSFTEYYYFICNNIKYYFVPYYKDKSLLTELKNIILFQNNKELLYHDIVPTIENKLYLDINGINYVLLMINTLIDENINLKEICKDKEKHKLSNTIIQSYHNNWEELWSKKNDYFEYQISQIGIGKEIVLNSFSYYIGLSENAIMYVNEVNSKNRISILDNISLCHNKIEYPNTSLSYYNPLNFIVDLDVRDIALYMQSSFFKGVNPLEEFNELLDHYNLTDYSAGNLFARLLYPAYYFNIYEKVIEDKMDEEKLLDIIDNTKDYEFFLQDIYYILSKKNTIPKIEWLTKL